MITPDTPIFNQLWLEYCLSDKMIGVPVRVRTVKPDATVDIVHAMSQGVLPGYQKAFIRNPRPSSDFWVNYPLI